MVVFMSLNTVCKLYLVNAIIKADVILYPLEYKILYSFITVRHWQGNPSRSCSSKN